MANKWDTMESWHATLPPNRPDSRNLALLAATIAARKPGGDAHAAVLGCTPEYREMLAALGANVHLFDSSLEFKRLSDSIVGERPSETFVHGDWLETLPDYAGRFDVICSHFTHGNVEYDGRRRFFELVSGALAPNGVLFDFIFHPSTTLGLSDIRERFERSPINISTANDFNACAIFQSETSSTMGFVDTAACYEWLAPLRQSQHFNALIDYTMRVTRPGGIWYYTPARSPSSLGYGDTLVEIARITEPPDNPFGSNCYLSISRKKSTS
jgi:hypothetical protein